MEKGIDLDLAREVLTMAALLPMSLEPLGGTLAEVARERELEILPMDFTRGRYFGFVVGVDGRQCLVEHKAKGAILLDLDEIPEGEMLPRGGDQVLIEARHGLVKVTVKPSESRKRKSLQHRLSDSHSSSHTGGQ